MCLQIPVPKFLENIAGSLYLGRSPLGAHRQFEIKLQFL